MIQGLGLQCCQRAWGVEYSRGGLINASGPLRLVGGSGKGKKTKKGSSFIAPASRESGQGGNSKLNSAAEPRASDKEHAVRVMAREHAADVGVRNVKPRERPRLERELILDKYSAYSGVDWPLKEVDGRMVLDEFDENAAFLEEGRGQSKLESWALAERKRQFLCATSHGGVGTHENGIPAVGSFVFDCFGAPFCGMVCIDVAAGLKPDVDEYCRLSGPKCLDEQVIYEVGNTDYLIAYAAHRGFNLKVLSQYGPVITPNQNPNSRWIILSFDSDGGVGHFRLMVGPPVPPEVEPEPEEPFVQFAVDDFVASEFPQTMCTFEEMNNIGLLPFECYGTPFCGLTCLDVAAKRKPDLKEYQDLIVGCQTLDEVVAKVGCSSYLMKRAQSLGFNLKIESVGGEFQRTACPVPGWRWIVLWFEHRPGQHGHYRLMVSKAADISNIKCPVLNVEDPLWMGWQTTSLLDGLLEASLVYRLVSWFYLLLWFVFGIGVRATPMYNVTREFKNRDNRDVRTLVDRRDKIVVQDSYSEVEKFYFIRFVYCWGCRETQWISSYGKGLWVVSNVRADQCYAEMQVLHGTGKDPEMALLGVARLREVNTDSGVTNLLLSTIEYLEEIGKHMVGQGKLTDVRDLVLYNADPRCLPNVDLTQFAINQYVGGSMGGGDVNYVESLVVSKPKQLVKVASCPLGPLITDKGVVYPGAFCVTDSASCLASAVVRGMCKDTFAKSSTQDFVDVSIKFVQKYIDGTEPVHLDEDFVAYYANRCRGKKSAKVIADDVESYRRFKDGEMSSTERRKFVTGSLFTKFESNIKLSDKKAYSKPRGIMMMSKKATIELAELCTIFDCWNEGPFGKFQVKHMSVDDVIAKIVRATDRAHAVTDFSSFESSITDAIREIERFTIRSLICRFGNMRLLRDYDDFERRGFSLKAKGARYLFTTRCSGHYWTSFANGLVNVCVANYCATMMGSEVDILAEGDDGIVPVSNLDVDMIGKIGFSISSELQGTQPGDNDFLKSRWVDGKRYLGVARALGVLWVKNTANLKRSKELHLMRCSALSLHHMSPGHPVLWAVCKRILLETQRQHRPFKGAEKYLKRWAWLKESVDEAPVVVASMCADESMREVVARGGNGFPPISIAEQLALEERLLGEVNGFYIGNIMNDCPEIYENVAAHSSSKDCSRDIGVYTSIVSIIEKPHVWIAKHREEAESILDRTERGRKLKDRVLNFELPYPKSIVSKEPGWDGPFDQGSLVFGGIEMGFSEPIFK